MLNKLKHLIKRKFYRGMNQFDVNIEELKNKQREGAIILDVRSPQEYKEGHLDSAILIPEYEINSRVENELKNKNDIIVVYCSSGIRSKRVQEKLKNKGYKNVYNLYNGTQNY